MLSELVTSVIFLSLSPLIPKVMLFKSCCSCCLVLALVIFVWLMNVRCIAATTLFDALFDCTIKLLRTQWLFPSHFIHSHSLSIDELVSFSKCCNVIVFATFKRFKFRRIHLCVKKQILLPVNELELWVGAY